jgi:hypothetical protein
MNKYSVNIIISFWILALLFGCDSKTNELKAEVALQRRSIERLETEGKRLIIKQTDPSLLRKAKIQKPYGVSESDMNRGFEIVKAFTKQVDNVDSTENGEFVGMIAKNIDPLDNKRNLELLDYICRYYTPTDYKYSGVACEKLKLYEMSLLPAVKLETKRSGKSPLLELFE